MTNQQGAPEALRLADALDLYATGDEHQRDIEDAAAELRRLHYENERLAAQVEAQQPTTHVQNPAEIEHAAGDVSKNGAELNVSTQQQECGNTPYDEGPFALEQPAPAIQQVGEVPSGYVIDLIGKLVQAESNKTRTHQEYMGKAMPDDVYVRFQRLRDETIPALRTQLLDALAAAAQADSQPAPVSANHADLPPLPDPDMRDVGTAPGGIKEFLRGYATEYAKAAIAARKQGGKP